MDGQTEVDLWCVADSPQTCCWACSLPESVRQKEDSTQKTVGVLLWKLVQHVDEADPALVDGDTKGFNTSVDRLNLPQRLCLEFEKTKVPSARQLRA